MKRMHKKRYCMNCYVSGQIPTLKYTDYWCATCEIPLCPEVCYDIHRKNKF